MTSRVPTGGFVAEPADQAPARPGLPLGQWLSARNGEVQPGGGRAGEPNAVPDISEIHRRLDSITQQIDRISQSRAARPAMAAGAAGLAGQLNDAISRLDERLARLSQSQAAAPAAPVTSAPAETAAAPAARTDNRIDLRRAVAEIAARRGELSRAPAAEMPHREAPPLAPSSPNLTSLERQLQLITSQMETLRRPDSVDRSIEAFREELAEIRRSLTEALPKQAIEQLEADIRELAQRIDRSREDGGDRETLANIERALNDIYNVVRTLTPAEQLAGYDAAIGKLSDKIDLIVRAGPGDSIRQLQDAIEALRGIAAKIASNEALGRLSEQLQMLGEKVDRIAAASGADMLSALERRIALLTDAMESRPQGAPVESASLEAAVNALTARIDSLGSGDSFGMAEIERRISHLLERLETSEPRFNNSARVEENLGEILRHLDYQRQALAGLGEQLSMPAEAVERGIVDSIKRELSDVRGSQADNDRRTQDTLEAVHSTLSHVVDRLSTIEGELKRVQTVPLQPELPQMPQAAAVNRPPAMPAAITPPARPAPQTRPELPNPALARRPAAEPVPTPRAAMAPMIGADAARSAAAPRPPIDPDLPPDYPLEPGRRGAERTAAAMAATNAPATDAGGKSNFIAAARRAAQAAAAAASEKPKDSAAKVRITSAIARATAVKPRFKFGALRKAKSGGAEAKPSKARAVVVGLSIALIVFGGFRLLMTHLGGEMLPADKSSVEPAPADKPASDMPAAPQHPVASERQSSAPVPAPAPAPAEDQQVAPPKMGDAAPPADSVAPTASADITGSLSSAPAAEGANPAEAERLPDAIGGAALRAAAARGEGGAAFEVAVRYAEGKGVPQNFAEATKWYTKAADKGVVPAMFRLATIMEKGLNGKKDIDGARRYYLLAAERGSAKAMHNLAVLDADGGGKGPNYQSAAVWFRKAAERGIADSQYNLGILYARGIGVEQNLAESFKWFSLAAAQGDADAARKRDDVANRLDAQSLAAAKLAIQTFTPERQPDDAVSVAAPAGGWDATTMAAPAKPAKAVAKPARQHDAAR